MKLFLMVIMMVIRLDSIEILLILCVITYCLIIYCIVKFIRNIFVLVITIKRLTYYL